jgi:hypothetical protein
VRTALQSVATRENAVRNSANGVETHCLSTLLTVRFPDLLSEPIGAFAQSIPQLGRRALALQSSLHSLQLLFECEFATCHLFLFLLFSRGSTRNFLGGVSVWPESEQRSQRKIRAPAFDTLRLRQAPQNPQQTVVIAFLKAFSISFTFHITGCCINLKEERRWQAQDVRFFA